MMAKSIGICRDGVFCGVQRVDFKDKFRVLLLRLSSEDEVVLGSEFRVLGAEFWVLGLSSEFRVEQGTIVGPTFVFSTQTIIMSNSNQKNEDKKEKSPLAPESDTLQKTDPQENMEGPVSSIMQNIKDGAEKNNNESKEEADEEKDRKM